MFHFYFSKLKTNLTNYLPFNFFLMVKIKKNYCTESLKLAEHIQKWKIKFENFNIPEIDRSLQLIISHVLKKNDKFVMRELNQVHSVDLTREQLNLFNKCCECRLARMPVQYIIQEWDFRNITLKLFPPIFIPRPETELLVDIIIRNINSSDMNKVLEIGCGSGAICVSLLKEMSHLHVTAIDRSKLACNLTIKNGILNNVINHLHVYHKELSIDGNIENFNKKFDIIVSNPPYLFSSEILELEPEIKLYEDIRALDGGLDGLNFIKAILIYSSRILTPGKCCFLEIHHKHTSMISEWLYKNEFLKLNLYQTFQDFLGYDRFVSVIKIK